MKSEVGPVVNVRAGNVGCNKCDERKEKRRKRAPE